MGYTGKTYGDLVNNCVGQQCKIKGFCINALNSFPCACLAGYSGGHLQHRSGFVWQQSLSEWRDMCTWWLWWWLLPWSNLAVLTAHLQTVQVSIQYVQGCQGTRIETLCIVHLSQWSPLHNNWGEPAWASPTCTSSTAILSVCIYHRVW